jgi:type I restriction enzyme, S subunit
MIDGLNPYPSYKTTSLPWLRKIPTTWEVCRNGYLFAQRNETGFPDLPILEVSLKTGVRVRDFESSKRKQVMSDREKYKRTRSGDIAYNMMRMWQGAVGISPVDGLVSPAYVVARPFSETNSRYFAHLFRTGVYMHLVNQTSRGIVSDRNRLYWEDFKQLPSPCPPPDQQAAIVRFIDYADWIIRRYIRTKNKLLALLNEQKQAIIHEAVTRGVDPNAQLRPSGIEWLGDVPEHWRPVRLKDVAVVQTGLTLGKNYGSTFTESRPYLRVANVQVGRVNLSAVKLVRVPVSEAAGATLRYGDVLMTEGGDIDKLGRGCVWRDEIPGCLHQNHVFAVRCSKDALSPEFLAGLMASQHGRIYFQSTAKQTTNLASTNSSTLLRFPILLPSLDEQRSILTELSTRTAGLDTITTSAELELSLLQEYRTRLIADVVTGKLDIREAAIGLQDDIAGLEAIDEAEDFAEFEDDIESEDVEDAVAGAEA